METASQRVLRYHDESKHAPSRYAPGPGMLDWETQPKPFRTYEGAPSVLLPLLARDPEGGHPALYDRSGTVPWDITLEGVAALLELSLGLSAWKSDGHARWPLRINPSSGNLHPTEAHLVLPPVTSSPRLQKLAGTQLSGGLYHYHAHPHALEQRAALPGQFWRRFGAHFQSTGFILVLTSIWWRESWKYGERAFRYCHHDIGHAAAAVSMAATLLGWKATYLNACSQDDLEDLLRFRTLVWPSEESEHPVMALFISSGAQKSIPRSLPSGLSETLTDVQPDGAPSRLSPDHVTWSAIDETAVAARKPATAEGSVRFENPPLAAPVVTSQSAATLLRQRRSALAFDGTTTLALPTFLSILNRTLPRNGMAPFDLELGTPEVSLLLFVHRVHGLHPGLYFFARHSSHAADFKRSSKREFEWQVLKEGVPLFRLATGSFEQAAAEVACRQLLAGRAAFSVAMMSRFAPVIDKDAWRYPSLFWECGQIGQVLYLEAEAAGLRGTGIGCFFDEMTHQIVGLQGQPYQCLYQFAVGGPLDDSRLETHPPYAHLPADRR